LHFEGFVSDSEAGDGRGVDVCHQEGCFVEVNGKGRSWEFIKLM
jgi:hypothetical protein